MQRLALFRWLMEVLARGCVRNCARTIHGQNKRQLCLQARLRYETGAGREPVETKPMAPNRRRR